MSDSLPHASSSGGTGGVEQIDSKNAVLALDLIQVAESSVVALFLMYVASTALICAQTFQNRAGYGPSMSNRPYAFTGEKTRSLFMGFLLVANFTRSVSLAILYYIPATYYTASQQQQIINSNYYATDDLLSFAETPSVWTTLRGPWMVCALQNFPSLIFLSSCSVVVLFWAEVYYTARFISLPFLRPLVTFTNIAGYLVYTVVAFLTCLLGAASEFMTYSELLLGCLFLGVSLSFCVFGFKVVLQFSGDTGDREQEARKSAVVRRVLTLSLVCPLLFMIQGFYDLDMALNVLPTAVTSSMQASYIIPNNIKSKQQQQLPIVWSMVSILASEWVPTILILLSFWSSAPKYNSRSIMIHHNDRTGNPLNMINTGGGPTAPLLEDLGKNPPLDLISQRFAPNHVYPLGGGSALNMMRQQQQQQPPLQQQQQQNQQQQQQPSLSTYG